jgi:hypothetical protein
LVRLKTGKIHKKDWNSNSVGSKNLEIQKGKIGTVILLRRSLKIIYGILLRIKQVPVPHVATLDLKI